MRRSGIAALVLGVVLLPLAGACGQSAGASMGDMGSSRDTLAAQAAHQQMDHDGMMPSAHMRMTPPRAASAADRARADRDVAALRAATAKYADYRVALADGFRIFLPNVPQEIYHFTSPSHAILAAFHFDPAKPTSLLYRKTPDGYVLVGAMYTAPRGATLEQLDERYPLSMGHWHEHTNICIPTRANRSRWNDRENGQMLFGPRGSITTQAACDAAGGRFFPVLFGWMVHVRWG